MNISLFKIAILSIVMWSVATVSVMAPTLRLSIFNAKTFYIGLFLSTVVKIRKKHAYFSHYSHFPINNFE